MKMKRILSVILFFVVGSLNAQTGPAGIGTNDGTSALKLWLDAGKRVFSDSLGKKIANESDRVFYWEDQSGSKNSVWARSDSSKPSFIQQNAYFNDQAVLRFSRNAGKKNKRNYMSSVLFPYTNDITIFSVFHPLLVGGGNNVSPYQTKLNSTIDSSWYQGAGIVDADVNGKLNDICMAYNDTSLSAGGGDSVTKTDYTVKIPLGLKRTFIGVLEKQALNGMLSIGQNGGNLATYIGGKQPINNSIRYTIGATSNIVYGSDSTFFDGYISSVIVFNKKLSEAEMIIMNNYLSAKYAIPLIQNDFFKMDEVLQGNYDYDLAAIGIGNDGISQSDAKGEGIVQISKPTDLGKGEYLFWAHNAQSLSYQNQDFPDGIQQRLKRTWRVNEIGEIGKIDLTVDTRSFASTDVKDLVLLIDTDNDGLFDDETLGEGLFVNASYLGNGKYKFSNINLSNENRFTFGTLKPICQTDCDAAFSPNGDGISDTYYLENAGKTVIYDKFGATIKTLNTPAYWDGRKTSGEMSLPGLYFLVTNESQQKMVTLVR
jgi:gliding motility-associated-like protein